MISCLMRLTELRYKTYWHVKSDAKICDEIIAAVDDVGAEGLMWVLVSRR